MSVLTFLQALPSGLTLIASPDVWNEEKRQLCYEFCAVLRRERLNHGACAARLDSIWSDEDWTDSVWVKRRIAGFRRQINADKGRGAHAFTICRPTNLYPGKCIATLEQLRAMATAKEVSIIIVAHAKTRVIVSQARINPFDAIPYGKQLEPVLDAAGVLLLSKPDTYSLVLKGKEGMLSTFDAIISFPVRTETPAKVTDDRETKRAQNITGPGCLAIFLMCSLALLGIVGAIIF